MTIDIIWVQEPTYVDKKEEYKTTDFITTYEVVSGEGRGKKMKGGVGLFIKINFCFGLNIRTPIWIEVYKCPAVGLLTSFVLTPEIFSHALWVA